MPVGEVGADAGRRIERRYAGAARAAALDQDALRHQLDFHLAGGDLLLARGRRARPHRKRGDQLLHLLVLGEDLPARRPGIAERIADEGELLRALVAQREDQARREAVADAETGDGDGRAVGDVRDGLLRRGNDLVHGRSLERIGYARLALARRARIHHVDRLARRVREQPVDRAPVDAFVLRRRSQ